MTTTTRHGSCLCGSVRYSTTHDLGAVTACHCTECRKASGHYTAATPAPWDSVTVAGEVTWHKSSANARRGFCGTCGSSLFWEEFDGLVYIQVGSLDGVTGLTLADHIFYGEKGDYYRVGTTEPCYAGGRRDGEVSP